MSTTSEDFQTFTRLLAASTGSIAPIYLRDLSSETMNDSSQAGGLALPLTFDAAEVAQAIGLIWKELLQLPSLPDPDANFFHAGGDSILMTMLDYRLNEAFMREFTPGAVLRAPTLRELSEMIVSSLTSASNKE